MLKAYPFIVGSVRLKTVYIYDSNLVSVVICRIVICKQVYITYCIENNQPTSTKNSDSLIVSLVPNIPYSRSWPKYPVLPLIVSILDLKNLCTIIQDAYTIPCTRFRFSENENFFA